MSHQVRQRVEHSSTFIRTASSTVRMLLVLLGLLAVQPRCAQCAVFLVTNSDDSGPGSLRQALLNANSTPNLDAVQFAIGSGPQSLSPVTPLPQVNFPVVIDGETQPGFAGAPIIEINGANEVAGKGLSLGPGAYGSIIRGLVINRCPFIGISIVADSVTVTNCYVGPDSSGEVYMGSQCYGIAVYSNDNVIGGTAPGTANRIMYNYGVGIAVFGDVTGNAILGNMVFKNGSPIDLNCDGPTLNDPGDADTGPNNLQNYPVLLNAWNSGPTLTLVGNLNSTSNKAFRLEFYGCDALGNGYGEGQTYLGSANVQTNALGDAAFTCSFDAPANAYVAATATDAAGNTSEFSQGIIVDTAPPTCAVAAPVSPTHSNPLSFTIGFSQSVTGFTTESLTVTNGTIGTLTGSDAGPYTVEVAPNAEGPVTCRVNAGAAHNTTGTLNLASNIGTAVYDSTPPVCTITGPSSPTNQTPITVGVEWTEPVSGFDTTDLAVGNGSAGNLRSASLPKSLTHLSAAGGPTAAVNLGGKLMFAGHSGNLVDVYDTATDTWTTTALPMDGSAAVGTTLDTKAYFASRVANTMAIYDSVSDAWTTVTLPGVHGLFGAAAAGTKLLIPYGGSNSGGVYVYDTATGVWQTLPLSEKRTSTVAISDGRRVLIAGGESGTSGISDRVDIYDSITDSWSTASLSQPRLSLSAASGGGKVLFAGGSDGTAPTDRVDIYDCASGTWTTAALSSPRVSCAGVSLPGRILFAGGSTAAGLSSTIDICDVAGNTWSTSTLSGARSGCAGVSAGYRAFIAGGFDMTDPSDVVDVLNFTTSSNALIDVTPSAQGLVTCQVKGSAARDAAGNTNSASNTVSVEFDSTPPAAPALQLDSASDSGISTTDNLTNITRPWIVGTAEPNSTIHLVVDNSAAGTASVDGAGNWSIKLSPCSDGTHTITASASDALNNSSVASGDLIVTVDTVAPQASITPVTPDPRYTPVGSITINFSSPVYDFDLSDMALTRDGTPVPLTGATLGGGAASWSLGNVSTLTALDGRYSIALAISDVTDAAGNPLADSETDSWLMDTRTDLVLTKTAEPTTCTNGDQVTFTLEIRNAGPADADGVQLCDPLPDGLEFQWENVAATNVDGTTRTWELGKIAAGETTTVTVVTRITTSSMVVNTATVICDKDDLNPEDNISSASVSAAPGANLALSMSAPSAPVLLGQAISYILSVRNLGPDIASGVILSDKLPANVELKSYESSQGTVSLLGGNVVAELGSLPRDNSATVTITLIPTQVGAMSNSAGVSSGIEDPDESNNVASSTATVVLGGGPDLVGENLRVWTRTHLARKSLYINLAVCNLGDMPSAKATVSFYVSEKSYLDSTAQPVRRESVRRLLPGNHRLVSKTISVPDSGVPKYVLIVIDPDNKIAENNEYNNVMVYGPVY